MFKRVDPRGAETYLQHTGMISFSYTAFYVVGRFIGSALLSSCRLCVFVAYVHSLAKLQRTVWCQLDGACSHINLVAIARSDLPLHGHLPESVT